VNIDNGIELIVLAGEEYLDLDTVYESFELFQIRREFVADGFPLAGELHEGLKIIELAGYLVAEFERICQAGTLPENLAGAFLVRVEAGLGDLLLKFVVLTLFGLNVKETSALPRCAS
jgi:hypothetical protein